MLHHITSNKIYVWHGVKATDLLRKVTKRAVIRLRVWFSRAAVENINEGSESKKFWNLLAGKEDYLSMLASKSCTYTHCMYLLT